MTGRYLTLVIFLASVVLASWLASGFEAGAWYQQLIKPDWTPPSWMYGPAWALVYVFLALAAWRAWESGHSMRAAALVWWIFFLMLNVICAWLLFGLHRTGWAVAASALNLALGMMCSRAFYLLSRPAAGLMVPVLLWATFNFWLNYQFWSLNLGGLGSLFGP